MNFLKCILVVLMPTIFLAQDTWEWETLAVDEDLVARHEAAFVAFDGKLYLIGGRRINPTSVFDPATMKWENKAATPIELHHFQPVVVGDAIYLMGAMTGKYPREKPLARVIKYLPASDQFVYGDTIPRQRRRGGAGVAYHNGKIYMVGGITNGHLNGYRPWFDEYDPATGEWKVLDDAPNARDHCQATVLDNKLYTFGGRQSSTATGQTFNLTVSHGNVYNFEESRWEQVTDKQAVPTQRAGNSIMSWGNEIIVAGGESANQKVAHNEVESYNVHTKSWRSWPSLARGRHGTGLAIVGDYVYTASGCGNRGGDPELKSIERLKLPVQEMTGSRPIYQKYHKIELDFEGPMLSETSAINPFTDHELMVEFTHGSRVVKVRGFFAADGRAGESGAVEGNIWKVRFAADEEGIWDYSARMDGKLIRVGRFEVTRSDKENPDLRSIGILQSKDSYLQGEEQYWLKAGSNSPENLLAYVDFDGTFRMSTEARKGEAAPPTKVHEFADHLADWEEGDPTWKQGRGKSIIGAMNYLASKGMNTAYFLTMNIGGDGKDVWPFADPEDFTRFDVSKLAQWEILFSHMQEKGIACHIVLQETENETLFDNGDTGPQRQLYLKELISRFAHHPGLFWNLGEENGPADWTPVAQNTAQRKAMIDFITENDPYNHPILLHTHSYEPVRGAVLSEIVGYSNLDGLSLQANLREGAPEVVAGLKSISANAGKEWLITMDEIGEWNIGALMDEEDPGHLSIRRYAIWGVLMSGAAGVEHYFGAESKANDLSTEEWRSRDHLWDLTNIARTFFQDHIPFWSMKPDSGVVKLEGAYCLRDEGEQFAIYVPTALQVAVNLEQYQGEYTVQWYDVEKGGELQEGSASIVVAGPNVDLGQAPNRSEGDWVILLKKTKEKK